ncbi:MAG: hypothetical protein JXR70_12850 [Spirochaetales bacterium]|nr:hypothetical protein [Spirochaetales bacterium]
MGEPVLVALLFADRVIEEVNRKKGIIGTFNRFYTKNFPVQFPPWYIYAAVTNLTGEFDFSLNLVYDQAQQVIVPISGKFKVDNSRSVVELAFPIFKAVFPAEGLYTLTFNVDGMQVGSRILELMKSNQEPMQA